MPLLHFSQAGLEKAVSSGALVMADFFASWCGPCQTLAPTVEALAGRYEGRALVGKVSTEDEPDLARSFGVLSIPTVIFFKNGREIDRKVGLMDEDAYAAVLDANL